MVAFFGSLLALIVTTGLVFAYGKRRPVGTPVTWGESIIGSLVIFWLLFLAYGIVPHQFLVWADGKSMNWRSDSIGIPTGPITKWLGVSAENRWFSADRNVLFPQGITFGGRGRVLVTKQAIRDAIAAGIYVVFLGVHMALWVAWQKRGKKASDKAALEPVSSYGRPLVKKA